jgi:hypothetical protein
VPPHPAHHCSTRAHTAHRSAAHRRARRPLISVATALVAGFAALAAALGATSPALAAVPRTGHLVDPALVAPTTNPNPALVERDLGVEPSVAVDPGNPEDIAIIGFDLAPGCGLAENCFFAKWPKERADIWFSSDGGEHWTQSFDVPTPPGLPNGVIGPTDQSLAFGRGHVLYASFLTYGFVGGAAWQNIFTGATNNPLDPNGWNWKLNEQKEAQRTNSELNNHTDQPWLLVGENPRNTAEDNVYSMFTQEKDSVHVATASVNPLSATLEPPNFTQDVVGATALNAANPPGTRLAEDPRNGSLYLLTQSNDTDHSIVIHEGERNEEEFLPDMLGTMHLVRETDGGQDWTLNGSSKGMSFSPGPYVQLPRFGGVNRRVVEDAVAVDPSNGDVYVLFERDTRETGSSNQLYLQAFTENDAGELVPAYERPQLVSAVTASVALPSIAVTQDGTVGVLYDTFDGMGSGNCPSFNSSPPTTQCPEFSAHLATSTAHGLENSWDDKVLGKPFVSNELSDTTTENQLVLGDFQVLKAQYNELYGTFAGNREAFGGQRSEMDPIFFDEATSVTSPQLTVHPPSACNATGCHVVVGQNLPVLVAARPPLPPGCPQCVAVPTGSFTFADGESTLGTVRASTAGETEFLVSHLSVGTHDIVANYSGDLEFSPVSSSVLSVTVEKAATAINLRSTPNPLVSGSKVALDATVSVAPPGAGTPTGSVTFYDNGVSLGTSTLDSSGHASLEAASLAAGVHSFTASYSGDESFGGSGSASSSTLAPQFANLTFSGSLTDKKLGQSIALPEGATFNGSGELNTETGAGSVKGNLSIPPFMASLKLFGLLPVNLGLRLRQVGAIEGSVAKNETAPGEEALTLPAKLSLGVTSLQILGLTVPTRCSGAEPLSLNLTDNLTSEELLKGGWSFSGTTAVPEVKCEGGFLGYLFGHVLSGLLSGPGNPYSLRISVP